MIIKKATIEDINLIVQIYRSDMGKFGTGHTTKDLINIEKDLTNEFYELGKNRIILIGFEDERPVGTVQLVFDYVENDSELADGKAVAHIHHLRVAYDLHKTGIGKILMDEAEQLAKALGFKKLTLVVDDWNQNAIEFYLHRGYKQFKQDPAAKEIYVSKHIGI